MLFFFFSCEDIQLNKMLWIAGASRLRTFNLFKLDKRDPKALTQLHS